MLPSWAATRSTFLRMTDTRSAAAVALLSTSSNLLDATMPRVVSVFWRAICASQYATLLSASCNSLSASFQVAISVRTWPLVASSSASALARATRNGSGSMLTSRSPALTSAWSRTCTSSTRPATSAEICAMSALT